MKTKLILKNLYIFLSKSIMIFFFDKKFLSGKWYDKSAEGWKWAWNGLIWQKILGYNRRIPWPVSPFNTVYNPQNIIFHCDDINNFQGKGKYFQCFNAKIIIGRGSYIASNVGIITSNHDIYDLSKQAIGEDVIIGEDCWIGMNSTILPGVKLGDRTIVGAGSVVTKSFSDGYCVIGGNPAKLIRKIDET